MTFARLASAVVLCTFAAWALAQNLVVEVIPLRYRTAPEVIPVLQPMLPREATISGFQGQIVVRTTPASLEEIRRILASIDIQPRQLSITVRQDVDISAGRSSVTASGSIGGEHGRVVVPPASREMGGGSVVIRGGDDRARVHVIEGRSSEADRNTQMVRVMEGREAYVRVGQSVPVRGREVRRAMVGGKMVEQVVDSTQYHDIATGFYVLPRLSGDRVTLDISPQREALSRQVPGGVSVQSVVTTVSGQLGEWIEIGGISQDGAGRQTLLLGSVATTVSDIRRVQVRVDEVR